VRVVLENLDATFDRGQLIVLVGRSGSGKSTLLNLISGIDRPTGGTVTVDGTDLTKLSEHERTLFRRHRVGFVFQSFNLIPTLTVLENLLLPMELRGARDDDRARDLLDRVDLLDRSDSFPDRLSGGERQRVGVARALAHAPILILADEPTGNLDYDTGVRVMDLLETVVRERGKTMIVATHDRDLLERADRIVHLSGGTLKEE
jgi:putative ABC transport system ATP-binding protein